MARLLKQQSSITVYRFPSKDNKLPFSISVCSKQTGVCCFRFLFAANKWKLPFSISSDFRVFVCVYTFIFILIFIFVFIFIFIYAAISNGKQKPRRFTICSSCKRIFGFVRLLTKKNRSYPFANGLKGLTPSMAVCHACLWLMWQANLSSHHWRA